MAYGYARTFLRVRKKDHVRHIVRSVAHAGMLRPRVSKTVRPDAATQLTGNGQITLDSGGITVHFYSQADIGG